MAEKITPKKLSEINIEAGTYELSATALSEGLLESDYSEEKPYVRGESLIYEYDPINNYYIVAGYNEGESDSIVIPASYNDGVNGETQVREIAPSAFAESNIKEITIPHTMRKIGDYAFYMCGSLETVNFESRKTITVYFRSGWENVKCYNSTAGFGVLVNTYDNGNGIYKATIPAVIDVNNKVYFRGTMNGSEVRTQDFYPWHGSCWYANGALDGNGRYMTSILDGYISQELENDYCLIGYSAFKLSKLSGRLIISSIVGTIGDMAFDNTDITSVEMPANSGTRIIDNYAFRNCRYLKYFYITNTVETIGRSAFMGAGVNSDRFYFRRYSKSFSNRIKSISHYAFADCSTLIFGEPESVLGGYVYDEDMLPMLETLGEYAFRNCVNTKWSPNTSFLSVFKFPSTMKEIGINAFRGCTALSSVEVLNPHGWNFYNASGIRTFIDSGTFSDSFVLASLLVSGSSDQSGTTNPESENIFNYTWYKIFKMIAPEISIEHNTTMNIKDSTGIAERFKIYARKEGSETRVEVAIVNAVSEADFE